MKPVVLVFAGIVIGCATAAVVRPGPEAPAHAAAGAVEQYCATSGDVNDIEAVDNLVKRAAQKGWELVGVYRPTPVGVVHEDYVCFRRPHAE
jgi:hypothetical protein